MQQSRKKPPARFLGPWRWAGLLVGGALLLFLLLPSPIDPVEWTPPTKPVPTGVLTPNADLRQAQFLAQGDLKGPEDVAVDAQGRLYTGTSDGKIHRLTLDQNGQMLRREVFVDTQGRPLGLVFERQGNLIVADAKRGLLSVSPQGEITTLTVAVDGVPFNFVDDLDIGPDGTIYFSEASSRFGGHNERYDWPYDLFEARPHGRLLAYSPQTKTTRVLLKDLYFANGVTLSPRGDYVLVIESFRYRIARYWLKGPKAGTSDYLATNLPGIPDGLMSDRQGTFWVSIDAPRVDFLDWLHARPWLKAQLVKLPQSIWFDGNNRKRYGLVLALDETGAIVRSLHDPTGQVFMTSNVVPHDGYLYLGTLTGDYIGRYRLSKPKADP
ncbi:SMP-30/gluconolactonase/LRE family protein [Anthocerotibacter panamensis]|uniref:SMP-30/gluconolactonase/LRE family protein n=1 Tax=Anthocerotibacter panamensis TaxID=2857077 RepID=UPI001C40267C|nr:SMP-30/gluconolactonase/LRE family protein [Anthocerotibacter panamensis]